MVNGERVSPKTMFNYINAIQRALRHDWKYEIAFMKGHIFACPDKGLVTVMKNVVSEQQAKGQTVKSNNVLNVDDLTKLHKSELLSKSHLIEFIVRLGFDIVLATGLHHGHWQH